MSWVIWITGLPGSGKTTLAAGLAEGLEAHAATSEPEQELAHRALAYVAKLLSEAGVPVIVDATASRRAWRETARAMIPHFAEVQLLCPPEICGGRERRVRWRREGPAATGPTRVLMPGPEIVVNYEYSLHPDLTLHTDARDAWGAVQELLTLALKLHHATTRPTDAERRAP
jgi:adenylylsulfate kinase